MHVRIVLYRPVMSTMLIILIPVTCLTILVISGYDSPKIMRRLNNHPYPYNSKPFENCYSGMNRSMIQHDSPARLPGYPLPVGKMEKTPLSYFSTSKHNRSNFRSKEQNYKTQLCVNYQNGYCKYGSMCKFAHGEQELRQPY